MTNGCKTEDEKFVLRQLVEKVFDIDTEITIAKEMNGFKNPKNMTEEERKRIYTFFTNKQRSKLPILDTIDTIPTCPEK